MSDQKPVGEFFPSSEDQYIDRENRITGSMNAINYSIPPVSDDQLNLWIQNAPTFSSNISVEHMQACDHLLTSFEIPSSFPAPKNENSSFEHFILHGFDGQSSAIQRKHVSKTLEILQTKESQEVGGKKNHEADDECRQQRKKSRSTKVNNLKERLRRQKLTQKMKALQEMIPSSNKMDQASILDEAIKYIKTLRYQVQMMSLGAGNSMFHSPILMMMPQPGQQIPALAPSLPTGSPTDVNSEIKCGNEIGTSGMFSLFTFPVMSQVGLPINPCFLPSSATSRSPPPAGGIPAAGHSVQNPGNSKGN